MFVGFVRRGSSTNIDEQNRRTGPCHRGGGGGGGGGEGGRGGGGGGGEGGEGGGGGLPCGRGLSILPPSGIPKKIKVRVCFTPISFYSRFLRHLSPGTWRLQASVSQNP